MRPKLIFISLIRIDSLEERGIYHDLLREFVNNGYDVTIVCPVERITGLSSRVITNSNLTILQVKILNIQKCNLIEKGISTLTINLFFKKAIKKYIKNLNFDLILYSTPPITLVNLISWLKSKHNSKTYLLLKDIFPQNAVDMGYLKHRSLVHRYFSSEEKKLYYISDKIGCMSPANVEYILKRFPELINKIEVNPNSVDLTGIPVIKESQKQIRLKWNIPQQATVFLYGGNLGKPQGTEFLLEIINNCLNDIPDAYFMIVGDGTDYDKLSDWFKLNNPKNAQLLKKIPKYEFDALTKSCDVGLILLRKEFTIPNFPSRLLTYLENKLPVLAITDVASDIGIIAENNGFGKWVEYSDKIKTIESILWFKNEYNIRLLMGFKGFEYLKLHFDVKLSFEKINESLN